MLKKRGRRTIEVTQNNKGKVTVALKDHIDELVRGIRSDISNLTINMNEKFESQRVAAEKADMLNREKHEQMNQFREQQKEERASFMTRELCESRMVKTEIKTQDQETKQAFISGRDATLVGIPSAIIILLELARYFK